MLAHTVHRYKFASTVKLSVIRNFGVVLFMAKYSCSIIFLTKVCTFEIVPGYNKTDVVVLVLDRGIPVAILITIIPIIGQVKVFLSHINSSNISQRAENPVSQQSYEEKVHK